MNTEYFTEMHKLIERAKNYEKTGREQEALAIYLEIHDQFFPNTSDLYERPAILLEKRKRFEEAIHICEKAIKLINEGKITGIKDNFVRRIERIKARPDYIAIYGEEAKKPERKGFRFGFSKKKTVIKKEPKEEHRTELKAEPKEEPKTEPHKETGNDLEKAIDKTHRHMDENEKTGNHSIVKDQKPHKEVEPLQEHPKPKIYKEEILKEEEKHILDPKNHEIHKPISAQSEMDVKEHTEDKHSKGEGHTQNLAHTHKVPKETDSLNRLEKALEALKTAITHLRKPSKKTLLMTGALLGLMIAIFYGLEKNDRSKFEVFIDVSEFESTGAPIGNPFPTDLSDLPPITGSMIDTAVKSVSQMNGVSTAGVIVQKNVTGFVIMLKPGTSRSDAKNAAENFVKALGAAAAAENTDLTGPNMVSYGSLYDYYGALVVAGASPEDLVIKGVKVPKALGFTWK